jgi:hypothetical protein
MENKNKNSSIQNDYQFCGLISGMKRYKTISLGSDEINNRSIVEITGEAGTGKSKLCYYFALKTILPEKYKGLEKSCLLITTYLRLTNEKLEDFIIGPAREIGIQEDEIKLMFPKLIYKHLGFDDFQRFFNEDLEKFLVENKIQTIIIDNITYLCEEKFQEEKIYNYQARHKFLLDLFCHLNGIILKRNLFFFCVNEVRASLNEELPFNNISLRPTMGKTWENNLGTRLFLKKNNNKRCIDVAFTNYLIRQYFEFQINKKGLDFS